MYYQAQIVAGELSLSISTDFRKAVDGIIQRYQSSENLPGRRNFNAVAMSVGVLRIFIMCPF
jgi:hypothetical protein